jgi:hypothetical protein
MMRALLRNQLRYMRPFLWLIIVILLADVVATVLSEQPLEALGTALHTDADPLAFIYLILAFALGSGLLVREIDEGTLTFLDGLPTTRGAVFRAKVMAAMLMLTIYPVGQIVIHVLVHLGARSSLDHALHPGLLATMFGLSILVSAVGLALGMLLGFLRYLPWLVLGLCGIGLQLLKDEAPALSAALDPANLTALRFVGNDWQLPYATIGTQLGAALLCSVLAYVLFKASGGMLARVRKWQRVRRYLLPPVVGLMLIAGVAGIYLLRAPDDAATAGDAVNAVEFAKSAPGHAKTTHFSFSYPALSGARLQPFIASADKTFADVATLLHIDGGAPIDVDLSGSTENHDGTAYHDRIRMSAKGKQSLDTLAHETTHVFATRLSGGERSHHLGGMTVFNEGLAKWVEGSLFGQQPVDEEAQLVAAIVAQRRLLTARQLTEYDAWSGVADENLKYPLGAVLIAQLVQRYGPLAPKTVLTTLARADFPRDLEGYPLWQTAFQISGYDLDLVLDDYARYVKALQPKFARQIAALPRLRGSLVTTEDGYAVRLRHDVPLPKNGLAVIRFRPGKAGKSEQYHTEYTQPDSAALPSAAAPPWLITHDEVCFQPGWMSGAITMYEPWVCLPVSAASP